MWTIKIKGNFCNLFQTLHLSFWFLITVIHRPLNIEKTRNIGMLKLQEMCPLNINRTTNAGCKFTLVARRS